MDGDPHFPGPHAISNSNLTRPINPRPSSTSSSITTCESDHLRSIQANCKRQRPIGTMQPSRIKLLPRRCMPSQSQTSKDSTLCSGLTVTSERDAGVEGQANEESVISEAKGDASPSICGTLTNAFDEKYDPFGGNGNGDQAITGVKDMDLNVSSDVESKPVHVLEGSKKVKFSLGSSSIPQGADDGMATRMDNLSSVLDSLTLTEMDWDAHNQVQSLNIVNNEPKHQNRSLIEPGRGPVPGDGSSVQAANMPAIQNQLHHLRNFLDGSHPMTQSSVVGSSCATTVSVHAGSAPILNSTTHSTRPHQDVTAVGSLGDANISAQVAAVGGGVRQLCSSSLPTSGALAGRAASGAQASISTRDVQLDKEIRHSSLHTQNQPSQSVKEEAHRTDAPDIQSTCPSSKSTLPDEKPQPALSEKHEKAPSRKKSYDPELFFKVNGKLYQKLGKIGSGGSSEVHKVISADCTIYALKKIKLKGRDYATAVGFCQEILYLKKLKGKKNIIQLVDYEVTDKPLLQEVLNDSISSKDSKVKEDSYIYMVLEYGEIDLAHMLAQKWKEVEGSNTSIDENWLRFYWQQILQAVSTIHEQRIVHSDLKPANFLLVKGFLKLIDFGIAKAIMSDTTNIQRDAQVGTLSYMSPEAFLCNEKDENGDVIKCGRSSDIWSLGCILYQMVYGHTPFSEHKTFWSKFKVITDRNHEIEYPPVSNPWLLDLMKKCLAWDRKERWTIPQLLQHPFLVPHVPLQVSPPQAQNCKAIQLIAESCANNERASSLCLKLEQLLGEATTLSVDHQVRFLSQVSSICQQLQEHIIKGS